MQNREEVRAFLTSRRAKITPDQAGLPAYGGNRRVPGLRREEVALLAGVSIDYYTRLERGNLSGVSESVLDALARALQLDEPEQAHLFDLARAASASAAFAAAASSARASGPASSRPSTPWRRCRRTSATADETFSRRTGSATRSTPRPTSTPTRPVNLARFVFLSPRARTFFPDWQRAADDMVAILRSEAGRNPYDRNLSDLIGELSTRSEEFSTPVGRPQRALPPHRLQEPPSPGRR